MKRKIAIAAITVLVLSCGVIAATAIRQRCVVDPDNRQRISSDLSGKLMREIEDRTRDNYLVPDENSERPTDQ